MDLTDIKVTRIDITDWLIKAIYSAKENESKNRFTLNESLDIISFELTHEDFDFFIDFNIYQSDIDDNLSVEFCNLSHVSNLYPDSDMIDFNDNRNLEIYKAVLTHL